MTKMFSGVPIRRAGLILRIITAIAGGWAFSWSFVAFGTVSLIAMGAGFHDAEIAMMMLGLLAFLGVFLWSFATRSAIRACCLLVGGAVLLNLSSLHLQRAILG